jgi:uncharacterized membrane protein YgdD (TMEM256/DUF423 family)
MTIKIVEDLQMNKHLFLLGSLLGGVGVILGAFGAHGLKGWLEPDLLATFETGVRYQTYHALALLIVALVPARQATQKLLAVTGWLFAVGTLLFSGSLYLLVISGSGGLGLVTPVGGIAFIMGWFSLVLAAFRTHGGNKGEVN